MSNSLVRKSLEFLGYEKEVKQGKVKNRRRNKGISDLISINHQLTSYGSKSNEIYKAKKRLALKSDPTEENIKKLLLLGNNRLDSDTADKLIERAVKKRYILKEEKKKDESTVFTEEDFKKFEAEYLEE